MSDLRKAAEMALERLESHEYWMDEEAIQALRQALAMERFSEVNQEIEEALKQPEQEPVAIVNEGMGGIEWLSNPLPDDTPLYTAPPKREWVGLTDEEVNALLWKLSLGAVDEDVRTIEAKLKEKNT